MQGIIFDIKRYAVHDGPGIRTTIFMKGCPLNCWWCHNPESISKHIESAKKINTVDGKEFETDVNIGRKISVSEVMKEIEKDSIFHQESGGGVTFSGGEPFLQAAFLHELLTSCKEKGIHTTVDTCGFVKSDTLIKMMNNIDLFLFDIKHLDNEKHIKYTEVSNKLILENLNILMEAKQNIIIRIPVIPNVNNDERYMEELEDYIASLGNQINEVNFLPYHNIASGKYERFGKENKMKR